MRRITVLAALLAAGCVTPRPGTTVAAAPASRRAPTTVRNGASARDSIVALINQQREQAGLRPLVPNERLMRAAQIEADQMARERKMAHTLPDAPYPTLVARLHAVGYEYGLAGENIAWQYSAVGSVGSWMHSPPHRHNILDGEFVETGVGIARGTDGHSYYAQVFGRPR